MDKLQWLANLVRFDTTSQNSNLALVDTIGDWLNQYRIFFKMIYGSDKSKANLFAMIPASNGETKGGIVFSRHTDVVPVDGQIWNSDPFIVIERNGKIYGRGTCDMKGFIAVVLSLVPDICKMKLNKPIYFSFSCDEEIGCLGVPYIVQYIKESKIFPQACIVGEPSRMQPITGYKGRQVFHCQVKGLAAHSSLAPRGCNAVEYASRLITYIRQLALFFQKEGPFDKDFDVPFTTLSTNIISGGYARNVIPANCEFIFEIRYIPDFSKESLRSQVENYINEELLPEMRKTYSEADIFIDIISDAPGFSVSEDEPITDLIRKIIGIKSPKKVSYSTEAGIFQRASIPTIICGPGDIDQAHRANEFITVEQLNLCENVLRNIIHFFCVK